MSSLRKVTHVLFTMAAGGLCVVVAVVYTTTLPYMGDVRGVVLTKSFRNADEMDKACLQEMCRRIARGEDLSDLVSFYRFDHAKRAALEVLMTYLRNRDNAETRRIAIEWFKTRADESIWTFYEVFLFSLPADARYEALVPVSRILRRGFHEDILQASPSAFERLERVYTRVDPRLGIALCQYFQIVSPRLFVEATIRKIELARDLGVDEVYFDLLRLRYEPAMSAEARARYEALVAQVQRRSE